MLLSVNYRSQLGWWWNKIRVMTWAPEGKRKKGRPPPQLSPPTHNQVLTVRQEQPLVNQALLTHRQGTHPAFSQTLACQKVCCLRITLDIPVPLHPMTPTHRTSTNLALHTLDTPALLITLEIQQPTGQPMQMYDPSAMATSQASHTPGAPQSVSQPLPPSYQHTTTPHSGWNDPPLLKPSKKCVSTSQPTSVTPITTPIFGAPQAEQTPPGDPSYGGQTYYQPPKQGGQPGVQAQEQTQRVSPQPEPPKPVEKGPIPSEHLVLQQVLDKLANQCLELSNNPHIKRKLEDVLRKLETLYDKLREQMLSENVTLGLHQIIQYIQAYDYNTALQCHARMVSQGNFSEISSFMPGIKMLMQTAVQMNVYIQQ